MRKIIKKPAKDQRERLLLLGLVELYIKLGSPIGSNTLREQGFEALSSATIRNYFSKLEEQGYLKQQHSSGGRIPTTLAYKLYAESCLNEGSLSEKEGALLREKLSKETREIASYLQQAAETISDMSRCAVFLSSPRFDQDLILDIKLVSLDNHRFLCVLITDFGLIHTEILYSEKKLNHFALKKIESYFHWKITHLDKPELSEEEFSLANHYYKEVMLRHIVNSSHFTSEDLYKTGFSKLLQSSDFNDASALASGLSLFENSIYLRSLLKECIKQASLRCWIGEDLRTPALLTCSVIAVPYKIHQTTVGAIGILGPNRIPYRKLFGILEAASHEISETLTRSLYKFKISYRQPHESSFEELKQSHCLLLENK